MLESAIDHLVVTAPSRKTGAAYIADLLDVEPTIGGEHAAMGTHNALVRLGAAVYLEVIAINPAASAPARPRWFELDTRKPATPPRLVTWVVRTNDVHEAAARSPFPLGSIETMTRGSLKWLLTIPHDGRLLLGGAVPLLIHWSTPDHPAAALKPSGCALEALEIRHPQADALARFFEAIGLTGPVDVASASGERASHLTARISTPRGTRVMTSVD